MTHNRTNVPPATPAPAANTGAVTPAAPLRQGIFETDAAFQGRRQAAPAPAPAADPEAAALAAARSADAARRRDPSFTVSQVAMMSIKKRIAESDFWLDNPLNSQQSYTYHFRLFMMQDEDYMATVNVTDGEIKPGDVFRAIDNLPLRIIAESGVTAGINIQDVKIESLVGPNMESTNTSPTSFTINLTEPLGTTLVETMRNAANSLDIRNMDKAPYFLELTFKGYDDKGEPTTNGDANGMAGLLTDEYDNGGRWLYQIKITNIETELSASGSSYTITALPYNEFAFDPLCGTCPAAIHISGSTVGEMLDSLRYHLNEAWKSYYQYVTYTYDFDMRLVEGDESNDPRQYKLAPLKKEHEEIRNFEWSQTGGVPTMTILLGAEIGSIVETIMAASQEARSKALAVIIASEKVMSEERAAESRNNRSQVGVDLYQEARMFRMEPDIEITGYNYKDAIYTKKITYIIWPFYTQAPVLSQQSAAHARDPAVQDSLINQLVDRGFFRKKYDYLFTGRNTEITRLDIRYNLAWVAVLPILAAATLGTEETVVHERVNEEANTPAANAGAGSGQSSDDVPRPVPPPSQQQGGDAVRASQAVASQIEKKKLERAALIAAHPADSEQPVDTSAIDAKIAELQAEAVVHDAEYRRNRDAVIESQRASHTLDRAVTAGRLRGADRRYLEDLEGPIEQRYSQTLYPELTHNISFARAFNQGHNAIGSGYASALGVGRGVYGAILEQMYGPLTTGLINIDMEIRGDPYWLSHSNVERRLHFRHGAPPLTPASKMANYSQGDNVFMLEFSYPFNVNEDGSLNIREEGGDRIDKFTGLYRAVRVTNTFNGGEFSQTVKAQRLPLHDLARAMGFDEVHAAGNVSYNEAAADEAAGRTRPSAANPGGGSRNVPTGGYATDVVGGVQQYNRGAASLDPRLASVSSRAQEILTAQGSGINFRIGSAYRTQNEQDGLVRGNRSGTRNSNHTTRNAFDATVMINGRGTVQPTRAQQVIVANAMKQASRERNIPITWGGDWRGNLGQIEGGHFELRR